MQRFIGKFKYRENGFTLIELLIVMAVLGIMSSVTIPKVSQFLKSASDKAATVELSLVRVAMLAYQIDNAGTFPVTEKLVEDINPYISSALLGTYAVSSDGVITQTAYPGT